MDPVIGGMVVALIAGIPASVAMIVGLLNRRDIKPGGPVREAIEVVAHEFTSPDRNGDTLREEVQRMQLALDDHVVQTEAVFTTLGMTREQTVDRLRDLLRRDEPPAEPGVGSDRPTDEGEEHHG